MVPNIQMAPNKLENVLLQLALTTSRGCASLQKFGKHTSNNPSSNGNGNGLLFHMTQPISRSTIKAHPRLVVKASCSSTFYLKLMKSAHQLKPQTYQIRAPTEL